MSQLHDVNALLDSFFGPGNGFNRHDIETRDHPIANCARLWIEQGQQIGESGERLPIVLPRKEAAGTRWYGIAFSAAQGRDLREQLMAFAGPTLSTLRGETQRLDPNDPLESALLGATNGEAIALTFDSGGDKDAGRRLCDALALMARVRQGVEVRESELVLSTGRVLRRFYMALAAGNRAAAESEIAYLRRHRRFDALNLLFLEVQLRADLGLWREILDLSHFTRLVQARRPLAVTRALLRALYQVHLTPFEEQGDIEGICHAFREHVWPRAGQLFAARAGMTTPEILKTFLLQAVALETPQPELRDQVMNAGAEPTLTAGDRAFMERLAALLPPTIAAAPTDLMTAAQEALWADDYDRAWQLAAEATPSLRRAKVLLQCAHELRANIVERAAVDAVESLDEAERTLLFSSKTAADFWQMLVGKSQPPEAHVENTVAVPTLPSSWLEWLDKIHDLDCSDYRLIQLATQGADEWSLEEFLNDADAIEAFVPKLDAATQNPIVTKRLQEGIPHLLRFFGRDEEYPRPALHSIYAALRSNLALYNVTAASAEWLAYTEWCRAGLEMGLSPAEYGDLLEETAHFWADRLAPSNLDPALDLLDTLVIYPCHDAVERRALAQSVLSQLPTWVTRGHLEAETWRFARQLAQDFGLSPLLEGVELPVASQEDDEAPHGVDSLTLLANRKIAIYTLTETAAMRARTLIAARCPSCEITLNHDKAGTTALQHLAQGADVFVMVTASAKHAATDFIEANRADKSTLLRVNAKGSSSIVRALSTFSMATQV